MTVLDARASTPLQGGPSFSAANRLTRLAFAVMWLLLARWTPRPFNRWRIALLHLFGARIDGTASIYGSTRIWLPSNLTMGPGSTLGPGVNCYCMGPVVIGAGAIVSQGAHLCGGTHDHRDPHFQLIARPITIGPRAWIAAESFVGPGVKVGEGAVLGARGCAFTDLEPWTVYSGNPCAAIGSRSIRDADPASAAMG